MRASKLHLLMYRWLRTHGWPMQNATDQIEMWKAGIRDHRIADDTMGAYESAIETERRK